MCIKELKDNGYWIVGTSLDTNIDYKIGIFDNDLRAGMLKYFVDTNNYLYDSTATRIGNEEVIELYFTEETGDVICKFKDGSLRSLREREYDDLGFADNLFDDHIFAE